MWYKEGGLSKSRIFSCQPDLVAAIPGQRVQVAQETRLFDILLHQLVQCNQCGFISLADKTSRAHFEAVHSAFVACDVCEEMCVLLAFLSMSLLDV